MEGRQDLDGGREAEEGDGDAGGATVLGRDRARGARAEGRHRQRTKAAADGSRQTFGGLHAVRLAHGRGQRDPSPGKPSEALQEEPGLCLISSPEICWFCLFRKRTLKKDFTSSTVVVVAD